MKYHAGQLTERVIIQRRTLVSDGQGGQTETWNTLKPRWAMVRPKSGGERAESAQVQAIADYSVVMRNEGVVRSITENDRILWDSKTLEIRHIATGGPRAFYVEIDCQQEKPSSG